MKLEEVNNYENAVSYCLMIPRFSGKNNPQITKRFYAFLGEPGRNAKIVHVAGTNGKGSVCAFMDSILRENKYTVGMFVSPHLTDIRERICHNREWIDKDSFYRAFDTVRKKLQQFRETENEREYHPSFFEMLFFLAMVFFEKKDPDVIILETGLGGRLDATNVISNPAICVITEIGYDHMEYLGDTLPKIASEKAGIIKRKIPVVFMDKRQETTEVIKQRAKELDALCIPVSKEDANLISIGDKHIDFSYKSRYYENVGITIRTKAIYQVENALLALKAVETLLPKEDISQTVLQNGIEKMHWEGRMEEAAPGFFLDGAHNEDGIQAFLDSVSTDGCKGRRFLLFSAVSDKQFIKMAEMIAQSDLFSCIYTAPIENERGIDKEQLNRLFDSLKETVHVDNVKEAYYLMRKQQQSNDYIYVAGSLYLIGQMKKYVKELPNDQF